MADNQPLCEHLRIASLNCEGVARNDVYVKNLLLSMNLDFLCMQETWMSDGNMHTLNNLCNEYVYVGKSGTDNTSHIVNGRWSGGVAILFKKSISPCVDEISVRSRRMCAVALRDETHSIIIANVYMPIDPQSNTLIDDEYNDVVNELEGLLHSTAYTDVVICGDFNTDFSRNNLQTNTLVEFLDRNDLRVGWDADCAEIYDTYLNVHLAHASRIDHFIMNSEVFENLAQHRVLADPINCSSHNALLLVFDAGSPVRTYEAPRPAFKSKPRWNAASDDQKALYKATLTQLLYSISLDPDLLACVDRQCCNPTHRSAIDNLCNDIIQCCLDADQQSIPHTRPQRARAIIGWSEYVEPLRQAARNMGGRWTNYAWLPV